MRKSIIKKVIISLLFCSLFMAQSLALGIDANSLVTDINAAPKAKPAAEVKVEQKQAPEQPKLPIVIPEVKPSIGIDLKEQPWNEVQVKLYKEARDDYKEVLKEKSSLFTWIFGVVIAVIGYIAIVKVQEVRELKKDVLEIKNESKDILKEMKSDADKTLKEIQDMKKQAEDTLKTLDVKVDKKLEVIENKGNAKIEQSIVEIEKKGQDLIKQLEQEANKQREISENFEKGLQAAKNGDFNLATTCFSRIAEDTEVDKDTRSAAYYNWGTAISELAKLKEWVDREKLLMEAIEKYQKAVEFNPKDAEAYSNWGNAISKLAGLKEGVDCEKLLVEAIEKYQKAVEFNPKYAAAYYNWGNAIYDLAMLKEGTVREGLLKESIEKYKKAIECDSKYANAYDGWANTIYELAMLKEGIVREGLLNESIEKYKKAIELNPKDKYAYNGRGVAIIGLAKLKQGSEHEDLLNKAEEILLKAGSIEKGKGLYNLACVEGLRGNKEKCQKWLEAASDAGILPTYKHASADDDLKIVRDEDWFKKLNWEK